MMTITYESPMVRVTSRDKTIFVPVWELMRQGYVNDDEIARAILSPGEGVQCIREGGQR